MNEFIALRLRARQKRDAVIIEARREYEATLLDIAKLEQDLLGKVTRRYRKISAAIESVIPSDRPFSTVDVMAGLQALDSGRVWRKRSIDNHISRLRERGILTRLRRATTHEPALYAREGVKAEVSPIGDATLLEVIRSVLVRPMNATEVIVAVLEAGYQSSMTRGALRNHVVRELRRGQFKLADGKWTAETG